MLRRRLLPYDSHEAPLAKPCGPHALRLLFNDSLVGLYSLLLRSNALCSLPFCTQALQPLRHGVARLINLSATGARLPSPLALYFGRDAAFSIVSHVSPRVVSHITAMPEICVPCGFLALDI